MTLTTEREVTKLPMVILGPLGNIHQPYGLRKPKKKARRRAFATGRPQVAALEQPWHVARLESLDPDPGNIEPWAL